MELEEIYNKEAGLISGKMFHISNRNFVPSNLFAMALKGSHLNMLTNSQYNKEITGSSIAFTYDQCIKASIGEFVERYCANFMNKYSCVRGSYNELAAEHTLMKPEDFRIFADWQYDQTPNTFQFPRFTADDVITWTRAKDYFTQTEILVPSFLVYMQPPKGEKVYCPQTSTGLAAGKTAQDAIKGGVLEAAERHAFTYFWYHQQQEKFIKYSPKQIIDKYGDDPQIRDLFDNKRVRIVTYDLEAYTPFETIMVLLFFEYKGISYQAIACASRISKKEAIKKAMLEAYQSVEFCLYKHSTNWPLANADEVDKIDSFDKSAMYYNFYPEKRLESPLIKDALVNDDNYTDEIIEKTNKAQNLEPETLLKHNINQVYTIRMTTPDVEDIGYEVYRAITPQFSLLSGIHKWLFLGNPAFNADPNNLFIKHPHPFP